VLVPSPSQSGLDSVSADSPSDAWAVGSYFPGKTERTLALHWNGTIWMRVPTPNPGGGTVAELTGVSALSSSDAWAVGDYIAGNQQSPLIVHWNGHIWSQVPSQGPASGLTGVTALSASDAWAVGTDMAGTLVLHWNGHTWSQVPSSSPGSAAGSFAGVSADSPSDAWAVGCDCAETKHGGVHTIILHWNGTRWQRS
jgi:hypothetical protein